MEKKRLRIMLNSNAPWSPSGYGQQVAQFLPLIAKEGYPTACIDFYGLEGGRIELDGVTHYPKIPGDSWGDMAMNVHKDHFKPDVTFTLQDIWTLDPNKIKDFIRWIPIVPIDHEPTPPGILERLKMAYRVVTIAPFGNRQLRDEGINNTLLPHTIDKNIFKIESTERKKEIRKSLGIPEDTFIFGFVAANKDNPPRKGFNYAMEAFAEFNKKYPNSALYFHTLLDQAGGFPIKNYAKTLGIESKIYHTKPYDMLYNMEQKDMSDLYNIFDCYLAPSLNEGFGVPLIEAQACGVPVIATDFTAMRDLVEGGFKIKVSSKTYTPLLSYTAIPDTNHLIELMTKVYEMKPEERAKLGKKGRDFVVKNYDLEYVFNTYWKPFLEKLEKEIY